MMNRNPLEVFGKHNFSLRIEGSAMVYSEGKKETTIPITSVKKFALSPPNFLHNGGIAITTSEGFAVGGPLRLFLKDLDESEYAQNIQKYITEFQSNAGPSGATEPCALDQIAKLKSLLDANAITEEEFEAKKKQLLGL